MRYFGDVIPERFAETEAPILCRILPTHVVALDWTDGEENGALEHLDELTRRYTRQPRFYGYIHPAEQQATETRVICRIHATRSPSTRSRTRRPWRADVTRASTRHVSDGRWRPSSPVE